MFLKRSAVFVILFFGLLLMAQEAPLRLKERYFFTNPSIFSTDLFPELSRNFKVVEISMNIPVYRMKGSEIVQIFAREGIKVESSVPIIEFVRQFEGNMEELEERVGALFLEAYKAHKILVHQLRVVPATPTDMRGWILDEVSFDPKNLKRRSGTFSAFYIDPKKQRKKLFFRYEILATLEAIFTTRTLRQKEGVDFSSVEVRRVELERITREWMRRDQIGSVSVKSYTAADTLLLQSHLIPRVVVRKGDLIYVSVKEKGVELRFQAVAQQAGSVGETIRVQNRQSRKTYEVKILQEGLGVLE